MKLTGALLRRMIVEEIEKSFGVSDEEHDEAYYEAGGEDQDFDLFSAMEYIFINDRMGTPVNESDVRDLADVPEKYYRVEGGKVFPTDKGVAYLRASGIEVDKY